VPILEEQSGGDQDRSEAHQKKNADPLELVGDLVGRERWLNNERLVFPVRVDVPTVDAGNRIGPGT
jgi:hypothetical protein